MRIIIAEDDDINRELIKEILVDEGYEVLTAFDGQQLIKIALENKPDLIITDIQMPNTTGDTMIAMIEEFEELSNVPIIVMTGLNPNDFKNLGVSKDIDVLFKPVNIEKLKELIAKFKK